jgi:membrane-bound lytic murein transglycosylase D
MSSLSSLAQPRAKNERFQGLGTTLDDWSEGQVAFWVKVYTQYGTDQAVIHDAVNLKRIYDVVSNQSKEIAKAKNQTHNDLINIFKKNYKNKTVKVDELTPEEYRLFQIHEANEDPRAYEFAADYSRIRSQVGQKDRLENAYAISKRYLPRMEEMFEEEGVPKELTRLPFVESGFVHEAKSSVGAIGIWQFMPKTAQKDLRVDQAIDERYDPLKSTRAAARFLKQNHRVLQNWSLAVMAYHHGPGMVLRAVKRLKTHDPVQIVKMFKSPSYQFASRNYLFEFLAMLDVDAMHALFFKKDDAAKLPSYITVSFSKKTFMKDLLKRFHLSESLTRVLNPHFRDPIWLNRSAVPAHYPVRLAGISLEEFRKIEYPQGN